MHPIPQSCSIDFQLDPHYHEPFAAPTWQEDMKKGLLDLRESAKGSRQMSSASGDQLWQDAASSSLPVIRTTSVIVPEAVL